MTQTAVATTVLPLSEVFGPTFQGEGPHTGQRCWFVRLGLCNLSCEWCDTPYTWDTSRFDVKAECPDTSTDVIDQLLTDRGATVRSMVVLSGGEPLMHHTKLRPLLDHPYKWHVETNGTIAPPEWWRQRVEHTTISPKVITTSDPASKRIKSHALTQWAEVARWGLASFKFVVTEPADLLLVDRVVIEHDIPRSRVWVMPEGRSVEEVLAHGRAVADSALEHGFHFTTRLHTLLWGDERGH